jgi:predicted metal-dependent hydrolase
LTKDDEDKMIDWEWVNQDDNYLEEKIEDFEVGKTTETPTGKTTITDIDPETQSVTWTVNKSINDNDIHKDLSNIIHKLESYKSKYEDKKRLASLLQKLKFIRNTFKRTSN